MANPVTFTWVDPTLNEDGTPITPGEVSGYMIGIRSGGTAGTYPITISAPGATATSALVSAASSALAPGSYFAAIQTLSATNGNGPWSNELTFTIAAPPSPPQPPTGFSVA